MPHHDSDYLTYSVDSSMSNDSYHRHKRLGNCCDRFRRTDFVVNCEVFSIVASLMGVSMNYFRHRIPATKWATCYAPCSPSQRNFLWLVLVCWCHSIRNCCRVDRNWRTYWVYSLRLSSVTERSDRWRLCSAIQCPDWVLSIRLVRHWCVSLCAVWVDAVEILVHRRLILRDLLRNLDHQVFLQIGPENVDTCDVNRFAKFTLLDLFFNDLQLCQLFLFLLLQFLVNIHSGTSTSFVFTGPTRLWSWQWSTPKWYRHQTIRLIGSVL